jgi:hypothetical protein
MKRSPRFLYAGMLGALLAALLTLNGNLTQADSQKSSGLRTIHANQFRPKMALPASDDPRTDPQHLGERNAVTGAYKPWVAGEVAGTCVDSQDHVFLLTRDSYAAPESADAVPAPAVMEFNQAGNLVNAWGDRNVLPRGVDDCYVDYQNSVWIAGTGDGVIQKYPHSGAPTPMLRISTRDDCEGAVNGDECGKSSGDPSTTQRRAPLHQPAIMYVDPDPDPVTGERGSIYIADGHGNRRVVVFDAAGNYLRQWGEAAGAGKQALNEH